MKAENLLISKDTNCALLNKRLWPVILLETSKSYLSYIPKVAQASDMLESNKT